MKNMPMPTAPQQSPTDGSEEDYEAQQAAQHLTNAAKVRQNKPLFRRASKHLARNLAGIKAAMASARPAQPQAQPQAHPGSDMGSAIMQ